MAEPFKPWKSTKHQSRHLFDVLGPGFPETTGSDNTHQKAISVLTAFSESSCLPVLQLTQDNIMIQLLGGLYSPMQLRNIYYTYHVKPTITKL